MCLILNTIKIIRVTNSSCSLLARWLQEQANPIAPLLTGHLLTTIKAKATNMSKTESTLLSLTRITEPPKMSPLDTSLLRLQTKAAGSRTMLEVNLNGPVNRKRGSSRASRKTRMKKSKTFTKANNKWLTLNPL